MYADKLLSRSSVGLHGKPCRTCLCKDQATASHIRKRWAHSVLDSGAMPSAELQQKMDVQQTHCSSKQVQMGSFSRRAALAGLCSYLGLIVPAVQATVPQLSPAQGAGLMERLSRALPFPLPFITPEPVRFPRKPLDQRFAVLLMRSSYDAVDHLDFVPRQLFEANFWKLRQSEVEGYGYLYDPLKMRQGDLTDPLYFDFISFSQYATISQELRRPAKVFNEYYEVCPPGATDDDPCESGMKVVKRQLQYDDDLQLPQYFFHTTGDLIFVGLRDGFRGEMFGGPAAAPAGASMQQLAAGVQQLLSIMARHGYALKALVSDVQSSSTGLGGSFTVTLQGPCNLWGMSALIARQSLVINAFDVMATDAYLRSSGRQGRYNLQLTESGLVEQWTVV